MLTHTAATTAPDVDLLQHLSVLVPCPSCGQRYTVTLRQVLLSQTALHVGCTCEDECPDLTYAALANEVALHDLERDWARIVRSVRTVGLEVTVSRHVLSH